MSTNWKNLLLALVLCAGMLGLSGAGIGPICVDKARACGCCPMESNETCCSAGESEPATPVPTIPDNRGAQQLLQALLFVQPVVFLLPPMAPADFPQDVVRPSLGSAGHGVQALLCVRAV